MTFPTIHAKPMHDAIEHEDSADCDCGPEMTVRIVGGKETWVYDHNALMDDLAAAWGRDLPNVPVRNRVQR
jgi:hypothetical protein